MFAFASSSAIAASLPAVKASSDNAVPQCATPGRLLAFVKSRNDEIESRFAHVPVAYMRHGEQLGVRWDYAFFQMLLETGNLSFERGNGKPGLVRSSQNNFAGLGATGKGERGESFPDIDAGVKAHLQHLLMYAGEHVDDPVADRTAKVQQWGILKSWQKRFRRPIAFGDIAAKWAPGSRGYGRDISEIGAKFYDEFCSKSDPKPELVAQARGTGAGQVAAGEDKTVSGKEIMRQAVERARENGETKMSALGAATVAGTPSRGKPKTDTSGIRIINAAPAAEASGAAADNSGSAKGKADASPPSNVKTAAVAGAAKSMAVSSPVGQPAAGAGKCRVWTASYGGAKSVIIRSQAAGLTNFTVLDVNDGQESRETDAYIAAYAKGGNKIAEYPSQTAALSKAFQLCPEG